jgi:hypothetical protein
MDATSHGRAPPGRGLILILFDEDVGAARTIAAPAADNRNARRDTQRKRPPC